MKFSDLKMPTQIKILPHQMREVYYNARDYSKIGFDPKMFYGTSLIQTKHIIETPISFEKLKEPIDPEVDDYKGELPIFKDWELKVNARLVREGVFNDMFPMGWTEGYQKLYDLKKTPKYAASFLLKCRF